MAETTQTADSQTDGNATEGTGPEAQTEEQTQEKTEATPEGERKAEASDKSEDSPKSLLDQDDEKQAPEKYELNFEEGNEPDPQVLESFTEIARELDLSQESAQKLVDKVLPTIRERAKEQMQDLARTWAEEAKNDKEIGGESFEANLGRARRAFEKFGSDPLKQLLNESGLGNHPEVIRMLVRVDQAISEDEKHVSGEQVKPERSIAERMFPNMQGG